jgi:esterase
MKTVSPPRSVWVGVNGLELHYIDWGNHHRPPALLLHGFLSHARTWTRLAEKIRSDFHVLALDQRGHGASKWADDGAYNIDDHFSDLACFINQLDLKELILIGHSMGGRNALFYAACLPERVKGLILVDARPANTDESVQALKHLLDTFPRGSDTGNTPNTQECGSDAAPGPQYDPRLIIGAEQAGYQVEPLWPFMEGLGCPTLIIRGEKSTFVSHSEAEMMNRLIPGSELIEIKGASHLPMFETPTEFESVIDSTLAR